MLYAETLYRPIYRLQGRPVTLTVNGVDYPAPGLPPLRFLDKTAGAALGGPIEIETTRPAAVALVGDLAKLGLTPDNLDRAILLLNNKRWLITSHKLMQSPSGEADGEVYMFLEGA